MDRPASPGVRHSGTPIGAIQIKMASPSVPSLSGEVNLTRYLQEIRKFPMLEPGEEYMLAKSWKEGEDREAADRLVTNQLRLAPTTANGYRGQGLPRSALTIA